MTIKPTSKTQDAHYLYRPHNDPSGQFAHKTTQTQKQTPIALCTNTDCQLIRPLSAPNSVNMSIQLENKRFHMVEVESNILVSMVLIVRKRAHCYRAVLGLDMGDDCSFKVTNEILSDDEVIGSIDTHTCKVGYECKRPDQDSKCVKLSY